MQKTTKEKKRKTRRKNSANKTLNNEWQGLHLKHDTTASVQALQQSTERSRREQSPEVSAVSCCLKCLLQHSMTVMGQWVRFTIHVQNFTTLVSVKEKSILVQMQNSKMDFSIQGHISD